MPWYPDAVKRNIPPGDNDPSIKGNQRIVVLHVADSNVDSLHDYFNGPSGGVESHFYVRKDGTLDQYRDTDWQADANLDANNFSVSIETQGLAAGTWTDSQLVTIKELLLWLHEQHPGIPLIVCTAWDGHGIGYHVMWGSPSHWTPVAKSCPGPERIKQFENDITPWLQAGAPTPGDDMSAQDVAAIKDIVQASELRVRTRMNEIAKADLDRDIAERERNAAMQTEVLAAIAAIQPGTGGGLDAATVDLVVRKVFADAGQA